MNPYRYAGQSTRTEIRRDGSIHFTDPDVMQLTLTGTEVPHVNVGRKLRGAPLGKRQRAVLAYATHHDGLITPVQAGNAIHSARGYCGAGAKRGPLDGEACCGYCSTDGLEILNSLMRRQLVERIARGLYAVIH